MKGCTKDQRLLGGQKDVFRLVKVRERTKRDLENAICSKDEESTALKEEATVKER